jgi:sirohydrochlorin cobaltochelatase
MRSLTAELEHWLAAGGERIGQVLIQRLDQAPGMPGQGGWELRHIADASAAGLENHQGASAARHLANLDADGAFRPLKTAPNLRRGWRLAVPDAAELRRALDYFYPAMLGVWLAHERGELTAVPLRETLGRQSGMYRITQKITCEQALALVERFCAGCLKQRLWGLVDAGPRSDLDASRALPMLCHEACNLLVAEARRVVKSAPQV